ncbi:hypothetical protein GUJ93_ZPchr0001g29322 [Zizania palustris]|uniref:Uncharacterized protein n=1 Tax=Zizania palustris TaxID=103762 RepID=A0A8J5RFW6_ZIZPA|nr:hypothetical protein GUJ93_ZPchr0001g29322 [Zizania palustris]
MNRRAAWLSSSFARPKKSRETAITAGSISQPWTERSGKKWSRTRATEPAPKPRTAREGWGRRGGRVAKTSK